MGFGEANYNPMLAHTHDGTPNSGGGVLNPSQDVTLAATRAYRIIDGGAVSRRFGEIAGGNMLIGDLAGTGACQIYGTTNVTIGAGLPFVPSGQIHPTTTYGNQVIASLATWTPAIGCYNISDLAFFKEEVWTGAAWVAAANPATNQHALCILTDGASVRIVNRDGVNARTAEYRRVG